MKSSTKIPFLFASALLAAVGGAGARGDIVELVNGQVLQGTIADGETSDEGLALNVFDTGGTVIVRWDHIEQSRRKELRLRYGIDVPEETVEYVPGHRVKLVATGQTLSGVALGDPRGTGPLRFKTRTGVTEYNREAFAGPVEEVPIDGLLVYSVEELYQRIKDEVQPEQAAQHKAVAQRSMNIGAYEHAKEHLAVCKTDAKFMATSEGNAVEAMDRQCDVGIKAKGAQDLKTQIKVAEHENKWNEAWKLLKQLDATYKDEPIRKLIEFDNLKQRVTVGRDTWFKKEIARDLFRVMDGLIEKKVREQKDALAAQNPGQGGADAGTLAAAKQWANKELVTQMWEKVAANLALEKDELEKYWNSRTVKNPRTATYYTGSFIVVKRAAPPGKSGEEKKRRPAAPPKKAGKNVPQAPSKVEKPKTEEEWWDSVTTSVRAPWLTAFFVETQSYFKVERADETNCTNCGGTGQLKSANADGTDEAHFCPQCNGCGVVRKVIYK